MTEKIITVDQLPDDPLKMPPPYWRDAGAIFHILDALESLTPLLQRLLPVHEQTERDLNKYYEKYPEENTGDPELEEFGDVCDELWELEHKIKLKAEVAILMSAIEAEDEINKFCVFNLHKHIAESIEKLSPHEKLLIGSVVVAGNKKIKSDAVFEASKKLSSWRNAFTHGHCVDRPVKSLRHNHLIGPDEYPGVPDTLASMQKLVSCYLKITSYLNSISINPYTAGGSVETDEIRHHLQEISRYQFEGGNQVYSVTYK